MPFHKGISNLKFQISNVQLIIRNWKLEKSRSLSRSGNWKFLRKARAGFTFLEILIAISIIAILSAIGWQFFAGNYPSRTRDARRIADVNQIKVAAEAFYEKNHKYPPLGVDYQPYADALFTSASGATDWIPGIVPTYEKSLPKDPMTTYTYLYYVAADRKSYNVWATLENSKDPRIYNNPQAQCKASPPPGATGQNYCGEGF